MKEHITKLKMRDWTETKAHSSWQIFKIMAEFVQGFETLAKIGPCVSIFGSARTKPAHQRHPHQPDGSRTQNRLKSRARVGPAAAPSKRPPRRLLQKP